MREAGNIASRREKKLGIKKATFCGSLLKVFNNSTAHE